MGPQHEECVTTKSATFVNSFLILHAGYYSAFLARNRFVVFILKAQILRYAAQLAVI